RGTFINRATSIVAFERVTIGSECAIADEVRIADGDYHRIDDRPLRAPVAIGDRVWIGLRAIVLKGVTIGDGAVVAASAVVTRDVPPATLVAGVPARVVREGVSWANWR